ncbi:hypothetical protein D3C79_913360 [compost metagenome]
MAGSKGRDKQKTLTTATLSRRLHQVQAAANVAMGKGFFGLPADLSRTVNHEFRVTNQLAERVPIFQCPLDPGQVIG